MEILENEGFHIVDELMLLKNGYIGVNSNSFGGYNAYKLLQRNLKQKN